MWSLNYEGLKETTKTGLKGGLKAFLYLQKKESDFNDFIGLPESTPLSNLRANLIKEEDMTYDQESGSLVYELGTDSVTVNSVNLSNSSFGHEIKDKILDRVFDDNVDIDVEKYEEEYVLEERSKMVLGALKMALEENETQNIIVQTEDWQKEIDNDPYAAERAYLDVENYLDNCDEAENDIIGNIQGTL